MLVRKEVARDSLSITHNKGTCIARVIEYTDKHMDKGNLSPRYHTQNLYSSQHA